MWTPCREAAPLYQDMAARDFAMTSGGNWLLYNGRLAEAAADSGTNTDAGPLHVLKATPVRRLLPHMGLGCTPFGLGRVLGLPAAAAGRAMDAGRHLEAAAEKSERDGLPHWAAQTRQELAVCG